MLFSQSLHTFNKHLSIIKHLLLLGLSRNTNAEFPSSRQHQTTIQATSVHKVVRMCLQSGRKALQGGSSRHEHRSHHGHGHSSSKGGKGESQAQQWYYVWDCDSCWQSVGMTVSIVTHCPLCNHQRCDTCPTEAKKVKSHR